MTTEPLIILMYHHIARPPSSVRIRGMYTTPRQFEQHLAWLIRRGFFFTTFSALSCPGKSKPPIRSRRTVILTFDDGHRDNFTHAFPILNKFGVPAVIFPVIGDIGKTGVVWPESSEKTPTDLLTSAQIRQMADAGIEFGSHLMRHVRLAKLPLSEQRAELSESKARLEEIVQRPVESVAYPYGSFNRHVVDLAREAGYRYGVSIQEGLNDARENPLTLNRYTAKGNKLYHPLKFRRMIRKGLARFERGERREA